MSAQRVSKGSRDSKSSLPDEVLGKVLSLIPTNQAASTSVLSKRWRNLLPLADKLDLCDATGDPPGFCDFVEKTLSLLRTSTIIKTFSLRCEHKHESCRVNNWIRTVLERRSFLELHLESSYIHLIETESFTSNTVVKLTLSSGFYLTGRLPPGGVFFPNLKTLSLVSVGFRDFEVYGYLISGCPVLEELFLRYGPASDFRGMVLRHNIAVLNPSVERLTLSYPLFPCNRERPHGQVFRTPSLVYLDYSSYAAGLYLVDLSSLVEARLDLQKERVLAVNYGNGSGCGEYDDDDDCVSGDDDVVYEDDSVSSEGEYEYEDDVHDGDGDDILHDVYEFGYRNKQC